MAATDAERDDAYRAVGRYVVEFSRLVMHMRVAVESRLADGGDLRLPSLALGEATASQVANAFFAICREVADLDPVEDQIARRLSIEVNEVIKLRNDITHGDWWIDFHTHDATGPMLWRVKPARRAGPIEARDLPAPELEQLADDLFDLRQRVAEFGAICLGFHPLEGLRQKMAPRVSDVFVLRNGHVVREGPRAGTYSMRFT